MSHSIDSSSQCDPLNAGYYSLPPPAADDSDMEMEDDITLSDGNHHVHDSSEALNRQSNIDHGELDVEKHLREARSSAEWADPMGFSNEKVPSSLAERQSVVKGATSGVDVCSAGASETVLASAQEKSLIPDADSPFRLLQGYASENSSADDPRALPEDGTAPSSVTSNVQDVVSQFEIGSTKPCVTDKMSGLRYESRRSKLFLQSKEEVRSTDATLIIKSHEAFRGEDVPNGSPVDIDIKRGKQEAKATKSECLQKVDEYGRLVREGSTDSNSDGSRYTKRRKRSRSRNRNRKRNRSLSRSRKRNRSRSRSYKRSRSRSRKRSPSRSCSRSLSPFDSRRRRSPIRRRDQRNRSPGWSSRNRRSRSRSPTFRRTSEFRDENKRQDRHNILECFDFRRGRCSRGGSCQYMHSEPDRNDVPLRHRNQQKQLEVKSGVRKSRFDEKSENSSDMRRHGEIKGQEMQIYPDMVSKDGQFENTDKNECEGSKMTASIMPVDQIHPGKLEEPISHNHESQHPSTQMLSRADNMMSQGGTSQATRQSQNNNSAGQAQKFDYPSRQTDAIVLSDSPLDQASKTSPSKLSSIEAAANAILSTQSRPTGSSIAPPLSSGQFSSQFLAPPLTNSVGQAQKFDYPSRQTEAIVLSDSPLDQASKTSPSKLSSIEAAANAILSTQSRPTGSSIAPPLSSGQFSSQFLAPPLTSFSSANNPYPSQLLPPPPLSQGTSVAHVPQLHRDYTQRPPYPVRSIPTGVMHPYQGPPSNQFPQFSVSQDSVRPFLPPPPPRPPYDPSLNGGTAIQGASSQFQQNHLAPRNDFSSQGSMRPYGFYPTESSHQMNPTLSEHPRPLQNRGDYESHNLSNQPFGGPGHMREDRFAHAPVQNVNSSHSYSRGNLQPQPLVPPSQDSTRIKMQNFSGDNFPSGELVNASSQIHPYSHNQQPSYGFGDGMMGGPGKTDVQYPVGGSILGLPRKDDGHQLPQVPDFGASRIQTHHNPYAATFDQPLSFKLNSNVQVPVDGQGAGSAGSRQATSSSTSAGAAGQPLRTSVTKQYDPLFDSMDPSGILLNKHDQSQKDTATNDSNMTVRLSGYCEPLDVEGNKKHTEVGPVASSATSLDNDGYGETADAEVGVVEDESLSTDDRGENMTVGGMEIDQVKSGGKSKKKKDSRSGRLFKSAVADFVKDLLKPSWRQGNMSKEAFKTIVKKTVDKVSGAMKSHQIPKSEAKINHYIDSSQRKLTKLVMGYVDKYVKV